MISHLEVERKYDADTGFSLPDLRDIPGCARVGEPETHTLVARYFDTEDLRLAARGITLRRREGGSDAGWHLKIPVTKGAKREITAPLGGTDTVPPELAALVAAHARGRKLVPVAQVVTNRTERALLAADGAVLAELADDTVTGQRLGRPANGSDTAMAKTWREIEVELVDGSREVVDEVGEKLRGSGARESRAGAKLEVVLGDEISPVRRPSSTRTAAEVMRSYLAKQAERMLAYDPLVRLADHDDDSVHKMRTSIRRIRSILRTHRKLLDRTRVEPLDEGLKWLADALGEVRDLEVLRARFKEQLAELPDAPPEPAWLKGLAQDEKRARERLRKTLLTPRYYTLLDALDTFIADPPVTKRASRKASKETPKVVVRSWRKMTRAYDEADSLPSGQERDAALHKTRKAAKRARYTAEASAPALGKPARKLADRAQDVQDVLGAYQDGVVAGHRLGELASRTETGTADAFTLGQLAGTSRCAGREALSEHESVWKKAAKPKALKALKK